MQRVGIIGAGTMGQGCAQALAAAGFRVSLQRLPDEGFQTVLERIRADLVFLSERGAGPPDGIEATLSRIKTTADLEEGVEGGGVRP